MHNLIESAKNQIELLIKAAAESARTNGSLPAGGAIFGNVEIPRDPEMGDYACSHAMAASKSLKRPPREIAGALLAELKLEGSFFESAEVAGPGFINFRLSPKWYGEVIRAVETEGDGYGSSDIGHGERVMVEYVSANPTGTMTIGNARGGVLGDVMASVLKRAGYDVSREFYINDAGNQVELFGRSVEARYIELIKGEGAVEFPEDGYHGEDIREIAELFREKYGDSYLEKPEEERLEAMRKFGLGYNIEKMSRDLERYGISYDTWFPESRLHQSGYVEETVNLLSESGHTFEKDGALWFNGTAFGAEKDEVLRRSNGFYTYFAADMAYHRNKFIERGFDRVINVLGADHHGHAIRFKKGITALGIESDRLDFIIMQMVRLVRDGETVKVSKRTGRAITLSGLLDEISKDAARFFFNAKADTHLEFDLDLAVRQDSENPVYYVQYAHARICSLIEMLKADGERVRPASDIDVEKILSKTDKELIKQLSLLPEEVKAAALDYDPSRINRYVIEVAARFHRFYNAERIRGEESGVLAARLKLCDSTRVVIKNCLDILGITAPEKM